MTMMEFVFFTRYNSVLCSSMCLFVKQFVSIVLIALQHRGKPTVCVVAQCPC